jgi:hypothetical protein
VTFTISADDPRTIRAIEIAAQADYWLSGHTRDGEAVFGVPSQCDPGRYYIVTSSSCDCPDYVHRALDTGGEHACKHMLAVQLHRELVRAVHPPASSAPARSGSASGRPAVGRGHLSLVQPS